MSPMMLGLSLSLANMSGGGGGGPFIPTQHQLVSTYCAINNGTFVQQTASYTKNMGRNGHRSGRVASSRLKTLDSLVILNTNGAEGTSATVNTYERALEISGATTRALYGGANTTAISGSTWALSDEIAALTLPADLDFFSRFNRSVPLDTNSYIGHALVGPSGQGFRTAGASQLMGTGAMNSSGTGGGPQIWPNAILGIPDSPMSCVGLIGDSIGNYREDANTAAGGGAWVRALNSILGSAVPWMKQTQNGHTFGNASFSTAPLQKLFWPYLTDIFIELSTNSMPSSGTVAERLLVLQNGWLNLANGARAITGPYGKRLRVHFFDMIKRDSYDADSTQHDTRLAYNAWGAAFADGKADAYYNTDSVVTIPVGADGIHPAQAVHVTMASDVIVPGYAPFLDPFYFPFGE